MSGVVQETEYLKLIFFISVFHNPNPSSVPVCQLYKLVLQLFCHNINQDSASGSVQVILKWTRRGYCHTHSLGLSLIRTAKCKRSWELDDLCQNSGPSVHWQTAGSCYRIMIWWIHSVSHFSRHAHISAPWQQWLKCFKIELKFHGKLWLFLLAVLHPGHQEQQWDLHQQPATVQERGGEPSARGVLWGPHPVWRWGHGEQPAWGEKWVAFNVWWVQERFSFFVEVCRPVHGDWGESYSVRFLKTWPEFLIGNTGNSDFWLRAHSACWHCFGQMTPPLLALLVYWCFIYSLNLK